MKMHDKAHLRARYQRRVVDNPRFVHGDKGRYTLGAGRLGTAKLAHDVVRDVDVVIKGQPAWRHYAYREARLHGSLDLQRTVRVLDIAHGARKVYIVMERGQPVSLQKMTLQLACHTMHELLAALAELHATGVYHRDLCLGNILRVNGTLKIADLGLAATARTTFWQRYYARIDVNDACVIFEKLLDAADPSGERADAFNRWTRNLPHLTLEAVTACPWLLGDKSNPPLAKHLWGGRREKCGGLFVLFGLHAHHLSVNDWWKRRKCGPDTAK